jgi:competence protein ComEC
VGSVAGIFLFSQRIQKWLVDPKRLGRMKGRGILNRLIHGAAASVSISLGTMVTTTPLCAWYFGTVSLIGILTNLLCLWVVTFIFCGIILACFAGMLWMPLAAAGAWLLSWPIRYILTVAAWLSRFPLAAVYTQSVYVRAWLVFCYVLLGIFLVSKHKRPVVLACCAVLSLCVTLLASWTEPLLDEYRVTVLDVGQGQCVLLQSQGKTYMVDCGGEYNVSVADKAAAYLNSQGIFGLDGLIVTHYDEDHVGAAAYLMSRVPVRQLIVPVGVGNEDWIETLSDAYGDEPIYALEDLQLQWGEALLTVYASNDLSTSNESSLCVLFHTEKCDILITGDRTDAGERMLLAGHRLPELDALIVGHHGAASSTGRTLLEKTRPKVAVISVGADNRYDHPSVETLERLHTYGCWIRRTDLEGTIILRG